MADRIGGTGLDDPGWCEDVDGAYVEAAKVEAFVRYWGGVCLGS